MLERALLPRRLLFGNPSRMAPRLSPDGRHLALIQPRDGILNIWVAPTDAVDAAIPLTRSARPLFWCNWTHDSCHLLYGDDLEGEENTRLWAVSRDGGEARILTPERGVSARILAASRARPGTIVVGLNERDPMWHDAWEVDVADGARRLAFENRDGYLGYTFDDALNLRFLSRQDREQGGMQVYRYQSGDVIPAFAIAQEDEFQTAILGFERAGTHYNLGSSMGRDTAALFRVDASTGERELLVEHPHADLFGTLTDPRTGRIVAARFDHIRSTWRALTPEAADSLERLRFAFGPDRDFNVYSQTADGGFWIAMAYGATDPGSYHLLDRTSGNLTRLFDFRPELKGHSFAPMQPTVIPSRDGLDLVSYLTLPAEVKGARPPDPLPMVLAVHGGPWSRDGFNSAPFISGWPIAATRCCR